MKAELYQQVGKLQVELDWLRNENGSKPMRMRAYYHSPAARLSINHFNQIEGLNGTGSADHTTDGVICTRPLPSKTHSRANDTTLTTD